MIRISPAELMQALQIWIAIIGQRQPSLLRDLWTRRGEDHDSRKIDAARRELGRALAQRFETANWEVMREETNHDVIWRNVSEEQLVLPWLYPPNTL